MSGHSKWATTKRHKAVIDAKRSSSFTKIANLITVAAREKGGDPEMNFSLRIAIDKAKAVNMPKDNIDRAIKKGTGTGGGEQIAEYIYEGIGPAKAQFIIKCLTDSKNRSASEIRHLFNKAGGALSGVAWNFEHKGVIRILSEEVKAKIKDFDSFELELIDAGVDDIRNEEEGATIYTHVGDLQKIKMFLDQQKIVTESADLEYIAKEEIQLSDEDKVKVEKFMEALDESEDVSDFYTNAIL